MDDRVREWHETLEELKGNHRKFVERLTRVINEYEQLYGVKVDGIEYDGHANMIVTISANGAQWTVNPFKGDK